MLVLSVPTGWNDRDAALIEDQVMQAVGIVGSIGQNPARLEPADQVVGRRHVVLLPRSELEAHRQAEGIDYGVDLGAEPASGPAESLGLRSPLFRRPPAAWA